VNLLHPPYANPFFTGFIRAALLDLQFFFTYAGFALSVISVTFFPEKKAHNLSVMGMLLFLIMSCFP
jgi:hypothetical protein